MAQHNEIGKIGESLAVSFLMNLDFLILERNFHARYGEIDIVVKKNNILHFVEVKTIHVTDLDMINKIQIKPEDNMTFKKWHNLLQTINIYNLNNIIGDTPYQVDLACVYLNMEKRIGRVKLIQNIHLD